MSDLVTGAELGPEFDTTGGIQPGRIRLKLGAGLAIQPDGTITVSSNFAGQLTFPDYGTGTFDDGAPVRLLGVTASGIVVEFDQQAPPDPINPPFFKAAGSVDISGAPEEVAGASTVRVAQGQYDITFNTSANSATYPVLATMQGLPQNDDYQWAYLNRTTAGFRIEIREQDNGGAAGNLRDSGFSFFVPII